MRLMRWIGLLIVVGVVTIAPGQSVHGGAPTAPRAAPALGPWINVWMGMDDRYNYVEDVVYNHRHREYMVLYTTQQGPYTTDLWARRVGADGSLRSWFNVATSAGKTLANARAAYSPARDRYLVVFVSQHSCTDWDVFAQFVPGDGTAPSPPWLPIATDPDMQRDPAIAYNSHTDEFLVAWTNGHNVTGPNPEYTVKLARVRASDGAVEGGVHTVPGGGLGVARSGPALAYNPTRNQYLIAYLAEAGAPGDIRCIVASADLATFGTERHVWDHTTQWFAFGAHAGVAVDGYLVAWNVRELLSGPSPPQQNAYARHISGVGEPLGATSGTPITAVSPPSFAEVSDTDYAPGYGYLTALAYGQSTGFEWDTYAAIVLPGAAAAPTPFAIDAAATLAWGTVAACAPQGECLLAETYQLDSSGLNKSDIRARFLYLRRVYLPAIRKAAG